MSVTVEWDNELGSTLRYTFTGRWTWEELDDALAKAHDLIDENPLGAGVNSIFDMRKGQGIPNGFLLYLKQLASVEPFCTHLTMVVGGDKLVQATFRLLYRLAPQTRDHFVEVASLSTARARLRGEPEDTDTQPLTPLKKLSGILRGVQGSGES